MTGACAIELDLICSLRSKSDKLNERAKLQKVFVVKEKIVKANNKQSDDSKILKQLEKLINSYRQKRNNFILGCHPIWTFFDSTSN